MNKKQSRIRRATKSRMKMKALGATRLVVNRTPRHIYAQVISADGGKILATASSVEKDIKLLVSRLVMLRQLKLLAHW